MYRSFVTAATIVFFLAASRPVIADGLFGFEHGAPAEFSAAESSFTESLEAFDEDQALAEELGQERPPSEAEAGSVRDLWGHWGKIHYPAAAAYMRLRNGAGSSLSAALKRRLRPGFGGLVDSVVISYSSTLANEIGTGQYKVRIGQEMAANCLGLHIYMADPARPGNDAQFSTLIHEMVHARQFQVRDRSYRTMGRDYFQAYYDASGEHSKNVMEDEARNFQSPKSSGRAD